MPAAWASAGGALAFEIFFPAFRRPRLEYSLPSARVSEPGDFNQSPAADAEQSAQDTGRQTEGDHLDDFRKFGHSFDASTRVNKAAQPARPAVSIRNVYTLKLTATQPVWSASCRSEAVNPPSGPTAKITVWP